jgi:hypothetical protein
MFQSKKLCILCFFPGCDVELEGNCNHRFHSHCLRGNSICPACFTHIRSAKKPESDVNFLLIGKMALLMATMIVVLGCEVGGEYTEYTTELMVIPKVLGKELMVIPKEHSDPPEINEIEKQYKKIYRICIEKHDLEHCDFIAQITQTKYEEYTPEFCELFFIYANIWNNARDGNLIIVEPNNIIWVLCKAALEYLMWVALLLIMCEFFKIFDAIEHISI